MVAVTAWHLALSNLIGVDVPHDLLALWLFPERGGVVLLAPHELGRDNLELAAPNPFVSQHDLFLLEERIRHAGYRSSSRKRSCCDTKGLGAANSRLSCPSSCGANSKTPPRSGKSQSASKSCGTSTPMRFESARCQAVTATTSGGPSSVRRTGTKGPRGAEVVGRPVVGITQAGDGSINRTFMGVD